MKNLLLVALLLLFTAFHSVGQIMPLTSEPDGGNKKASVSEKSAL